jgi:hypothetical protein
VQLQTRYWDFIGDLAPWPSAAGRKRLTGMCAGHLPRPVAGRDRRRYGITKENATAKGGELNDWCGWRGSAPTPALPVHHRLIGLLCSTVL